MKIYIVLSTFLFLAACSSAEEKSWYRGNTHAHSLWSDGNDFPEMIVGWYKDRGYDFVALSDHNILAVGEKWMSLESIKERQIMEGPGAFEKYQEKYDESWIEIRDSKGKQEVRLKRIEEYRKLFEKPGEFLVLQAEEISSSSQDKPVHMNAVNLPGKSIIPFIKDDTSVEDIMRAHLKAAKEIENETNQAILVHLNHPNFRWAITAEELANVVEEQFFEIYNGHPNINHLGDATRPGDEHIWDIANTIRLAKLDAEPLFGIATDDSHTYHGGDVSPGRGWIMVQADRLEGSALINAMRAGNCYSSTGVYLDLIDYDPGNRTLSTTIDAEAGVTYMAQLIGTKEEYQSPSEIGEILDEQTGTKLSFNIPQDVLYARVTISSNKPHPNPSFENQVEQAWLQPVGWR